jgi:hypothetical protein
MAESADEAGAVLFEPIEQGSAGALGDLALHKPADAEQGEQAIQSDRVTRSHPVILRSGLGRRLSDGVARSHPVTLRKSAPEPQREVPVEVGVNGAGGHPAHHVGGELGQQHGQGLLVVGLEDGGGGILHVLAPALEAGVVALAGLFGPEGEALQGGGQEGEQFGEAALGAAPFLRGLGAEEGADGPVSEHLGPAVEARAGGVHELHAGAHHEETGLGVALRHIGDAQAVGVGFVVAHAEVGVVKKALDVEFLGLQGLEYGVEELGAVILGALAVEQQQVVHGLGLGAELEGGHAAFFGGGQYAAGQVEPEGIGGAAAAHGLQGVLEGVAEHDAVGGTFDADVPEVGRLVGAVEFGDEFAAAPFEPAPEGEEQGAEQAEQQPAEPGPVGREPGFPGVGIRDDEVEQGLGVVY